MSSTTPLSVGGLSLALIILYANLRTWWKSPGRDPKVLGPFLGGFSLGSLSTLCVGGVLGILAGWILGTTNRVGAHASPGSTGTPDSSLTRGFAGTLTPGGGLMVTLLTAVMVLAWRSTPKGDEGKRIRRRMIGGIVCGVALAVSAAVSGMLNETLVPLANGSGDSVIHWINTQGHTL